MHGTYIWGFFCSSLLTFKNACSADGSFFSLILIPLYKIRGVFWNGSKEIIHLRQVTCQNTVACNIVIFCGSLHISFTYEFCVLAEKKNEDLSALCNPFSYDLKLPTRIS